METFNITYSNKNIPIPSENKYKLKLIMKTENLLKRMRWKALAFLSKLKGSDKENFGFKTVKCPSSVKELVPFENDMMQMIKNLEPKRVHSEFQSILNKDIREIHRSNIYRINKTCCEHLIHDNVTKTYKKCNDDKAKTLNIKAKKIASKLKLEDGIRILHDNDACISIKDHKEGFPDKISCRLINPSKTDIGKISKQILDKVNTSILEKIKVNQWKNTSSVIE